jgi:hypothetical protein
MAMFARVRRTVGGFLFGVRAGLFAVAGGAFLFLGWLIGDIFWGRGADGLAWAIIFVLFPGAALTDRSGRSWRSSSPSRWSTCSY